MKHTTDPQRVGRSSFFPGAYIGVQFIIYIISIISHLKVEASIMAKPDYDWHKVVIVIIAFEVAMSALRITRTTLSITQHVSIVRSEHVLVDLLQKAIFSTYRIKDNTKQIFLLLNP